MPSCVATVSGHRSSHTAQLACYWPTSSVAVVSAHGEIDASNAGNLTDLAIAHVTRCRGLVLDLSGLDFFGTEGFSVLHRVSVSCARVGIGWAMVPGAAVTQVLRICDPQGSLPSACTVEAAIATIQRPSPPRLELNGRVDIRRDARDRIDALQEDRSWSPRTRRAR